MWMTLMLVINVELQNFQNRVIGIINFESFFLKMYRRHHKLVIKFNVRLKSLLQLSLPEPEFYGDFVYFKEGQTFF